MTVGILSEIIAKSRVVESGSGPSDVVDDGSAKYGEPLVPILNDRLVYDEPYTTDASPHQYRIWLAQVGDRTIYLTPFYSFVSFSASTTTPGLGMSPLSTRR